MTDRSEEQLAADRRLNAQCFLLAHLDTFEGWGRAVGYGSMFKLTGGSPIKFVSSLFSRKDLKDVLHIKPAEVSGLVPYIKIYKVYYESETDEGTAYEVRFENHLTESSIDSMLADRRTRGNGVGLKSFEWILAGGNPVEADRMIEAKMVLFFESMDDLLISQRVEPEQVQGREAEARDVRYVDLIHQANKFNVDGCTGDSVYNNKYFRIRATVGWSAPEGATDEQTAAATLMQESTITVFLTMTKHDISFDDQGGVTLTINYMAASEGLMADPRADILALDQEATRQMNEAQQTIDQGQRDAARACPQGFREDPDSREVEARADAEEAMAEQIATATAQRYKSFLEEIEKNNAIYYVDVPKEEVDAYQDSWFFGLISGDPLTPREMARQRIEKMQEQQTGSRSWAANGPQQRPDGVAPAFTSVTDNLEDPEAGIDVGDRGEPSMLPGFVQDFRAWAGNRIGDNEFACEDSSKTRINYLFLGGILHTAFQAVGGNGVMAEIRNVVGPFEYMDPLTGWKKSICLADIPISLDMFKQWFFDNAVVPQRRTWTLKDFIQHLIAGLVAPAMGQDCFGACTSGFRSRVNMRVLEVPLADDGKCRLTGRSGIAIGGNATSTFRAVGSSTAPTGSVVTQQQLLDNYPVGDAASGLRTGSYMLLYSSGASTNMGPPSGDETREDRDNDLGVYHFVLGSDRGLVKKIQFKREDSPHTEAARISADGPGNLAIRAMYNADVDLVGNGLFMPGQLVFINAGAFTAGGDSGTAGSAASILGIGGYYLVTKVENVLEAGRYETKLNCIWQSFGEAHVRSLERYCQVEENESCPDREAGDNCLPVEEEPSTSATPGAPST